MSPDIGRLKIILKKATDLDKGQLVKDLKNNNISDIENHINSNSYSLNNSEKNFLIPYKQSLAGHEQNAKKINLIKSNFRKIEEIYNELENEISEAMGESQEMEKIGRMLSDKELIKNSKYDEAEVNDLRKKLNHLTKMKKKMEKKESKLESLTENFNHIEHLLMKRIELIDLVIDNSDDSRSEKNAKSGTKLKKGMQLVSSGGGYTLVIDEEKPPTAMMSGINAAINSGMPDHEKAEQACYRVGNMLDSPGDDAANNARISSQKRSDGNIYLSDVWSDNLGVCKEFAATLQLVYQKIGIQSKYMRGELKGERHAWLKVNTGGSTFLADPIRGIFVDYSSIPDYSEGDNLVRTP